MKLCVLLEIETEDPRIDGAMVASVAGTMLLRQAVMEALPRDVTRLVAVIPVELAKIMMEAHNEVAAAIGNPPAYPPRAYRPPGRRR